MPTHTDVLDFSAKLAPLVGRKVLADRSESRVALIGTELMPVVLPPKVREFPADLGIAKPQSYKLPTI